MIRMIGRWFQERREARIRAIAKWNKHQEWLQYMRRKGVIMPLPRPDERDLTAMHNRLIGCKQAL